MQCLMIVCSGLSRKCCWTYLQKICVFCALYHFHMDVHFSQDLMFHWLHFCGTKWNILWFLSQDWFIYLLFNEFLRFKKWLHPRGSVLALCSVPSFPFPSWIYSIDFASRTFMCQASVMSGVFRWSIITSIIPKNWWMLSSLAYFPCMWLVPPSTTKWWPWMPTSGVTSTSHFVPKIPSRFFHHAIIVEWVIW